MQFHSIRAAYSADTIRVYQAYRPEIARPALARGRFVAPFSMNRMTWIKPSFNWMMYRCGYASKPDQEVVLAIDITREGFEWALRHAALSTFTPSVHTSQEQWKSELSTAPVRVQWDPERNWKLDVIDGVRAIQIGLSGEAVKLYVNEWTRAIADVTPIARELSRHAQAGTVPDTRPEISETEYPVSQELRERICAA